SPWVFRGRQDRVGAVRLRDGGRLVFLPFKWLKLLENIDFHVFGSKSLREVESFFSSRRLRRQKEKTTSPSKKQLFAPGSRWQTTSQLPPVLSLNLPVAPREGASPFVKNKNFKRTAALAGNQAKSPGKSTVLC